MAAKTPGTDDLAAIREELRAEIREARETLKDLRTEIRTARAMAEEVMHAEVKRQMDALKKVSGDTIDKAAQKVIAEFDQLRDLLMMNTPRDRRQGRPTLDTYIRKLTEYESADHD